MLKLLFSGRRYAFVTRKALSEFTDARNRLIDCRNKPVNLHGKVGQRVHNFSIYDSDLGMLPDYGGHVQGNDQYPFKSSLNTFYCFNA